MISGYAKSRRRRFSGPLAVVLALLLSVVSVEATSAQQVDGRVLADACTSCHGIDGHSTGAIPSIGGVDKQILLTALKGFETDKTDATIMNRIVRGYTDAELEALADFFSQVKSK